jgi:hypothetical protein
MAVGLIWVGMFILVVGYFFYRADKKVKEKFQDKFNPQDWGVSPPPQASPPSAMTVPVKPTASVSPVMSRSSSPGYHRQPQWFTAAQLKMHRQLQQALAGDYVLLAKIALSDLVTAPAILESRLQRQVDFVVCKPQDLAPLCLVVDESRLNALDAHQLEDICRSVQLPLVKLAAADLPTGSELRGQLLAAMGVAAVEEHKSCPLCGAAMRQRQINSGAQAGRRLWVCSTYPACKGWQAIS